MKLTQHSEAKGIRLELECHTRSALAHKLITENPRLEKTIKGYLASVSADILDILSQELTYRKSQGLQVEELE